MVLVTGSQAKLEDENRKSSFMDCDLSPRQIVERSSFSVVARCMAAPF